MDTSASTHDPSKKLTHLTHCLLCSQHSNSLDAVTLQNWIITEMNATALLMKYSRCTSLKVCNLRSFWSSSIHTTVVNPAYFVEQCYDLSNLLCKFSCWYHDETLQQHQQPATLAAVEYQSYLQSINWHSNVLTSCDLRSERNTSLSKQETDGTPDGECRTRSQVHRCTDWEV